VALSGATRPSRGTQPGVQSDVWSGVGPGVGVRSDVWSGVGPGVGPGVWPGVGVRSDVWSGVGTAGVGENTPQIWAVFKMAALLLQV